MKTINKTNKVEQFLARQAKYAHCGQSITFPERGVYATFDIQRFPGGGAPGCAVTENRSNDHQHDVRPAYVG